MSAGSLAGKKRKAESDPPIDAATLECVAPAPTEEKVEIIPLADTVITDPPELPAMENRRRYTRDE
jgi:hypothetical protein